MASTRSSGCSLETATSSIADASRPAAFAASAMRERMAARAAATSGRETVMRSPHLLAALARRLNRDAGGPAIPSLFFFTDPERTPDPVGVAKRLPRGTAVVYRHFGADERADVARRLVRVCRSHGLVLLIAAD